MYEVIIPLLVGLLCAGVAYTLGRRSQEKEVEDLKRQIEIVAKQTASRQRSVIKGQIAEQLYPLSQDCPYLPSDMRFIGHPVDYLIIDGYTECKDDGGDIREVILADIKTGNARLSPHQRAIKEAVEQGRVRWLTIKQ